MKRSGFIVTCIVVALIVLATTGLFVYRNLRGAGPALRPPKESIIDLFDIPKNQEPVGETSKTPLQLPAGFSIRIFAKDLPGARVIAFDGYGLVAVSQPTQGKVTTLTTENNFVTAQAVSLPAFANMQKPHGILFDGNNVAPSLYIAEENRITKTLLAEGQTPIKIADLPTGGRHTTRTLGLGQDGRLYVSIGSSCDVCHENDERRATIYSMNPDGSDFKLFAKGLRNSVFFTWHPITQEMWATDMGRDFLGDNLPPDEVNIIKADANYGWPICYGKNIHDTTFDKNTYIRNPCMDPFEQSSYIDLQAHSAPLGLAFVPANSAWPKEYWNDLLVAYHGSWNRSQPTGYKVVRFPLDEQGQSQGESVDFITGWFPTDGRGTEAALGRPVDLKFGPDGGLYISDDKAGVIYRVTYSSNE